MTLALPLLSSLRARGTPAAFPKRLITMYTPNGQISDAWFPKTVTSETDFVLNEIHEPLAAHRDKLVLFKGLDIRWVEAAKTAETARDLLARLGLGPRPPPTRHAPAFGQLELPLAY